MLVPPSTPPPAIAGELVVREEEEEERRRGVLNFGNDALMLPVRIERKTETIKNKDNKQDGEKKIRKNIKKHNKRRKNKESWKAVNRRALSQSRKTAKLHLPF